MVCTCPCAPPAAPCQDHFIAVYPSIDRSIPLDDVRFYNHGPFALAPNFRGERCARCGLATPVLWRNPEDAGQYKGGYCLDCRREFEEVQQPEEQEKGPLYDVFLTGVLIATVEARDVDQAKRKAANMWRAMMDGYNNQTASRGKVDLDFGFDGTEIVVDARTGKEVRRRNSLGSRE